MRNLEPHITVRAVQPVIAALETLGHQVDSLLAEAKISRATLQNADGQRHHVVLGTRPNGHARRPSWHSPR